MTMLENLPLCPLCEINQQEEGRDRCTECYNNTCAKCGEESNGDFCRTCGFQPKFYL